MATHTSVRVVASLAVVLLLGTAVRARAQTVQHIRVQSPHLTNVVTTAIGRSATLRSLVQRIEESDVIVYLSCAHFQSLLTRGRTMLVTATPEARYVRVDIACPEVYDGIATIVAHEFQHVLEIATSPSVVDSTSFVRLFSEIGFTTCVDRGGRQFETTAAQQIGERVRRELRQKPESGARVAARAHRHVAADRDVGRP